jgi:hypothetical protein
VRDSSEVAETWERSYGEWFAWARETLGADQLGAHEAAEAAVEALRSGADTTTATAAATRAARGSTRLAALNVPPRRRAYAEWYDWARIETGERGESLHSAALSALRAMEAGRGASGAAEAARATLGMPEHGGGGLRYWRSPLRVGVLMLFCGMAPVIALLPSLGVFGALLATVPVVGIYWAWWNWQLFRFVSAERLPGAKAFWWALVPLYGYFAIWRQLRATVRAAAAAGFKALPPVLLLAMLVTVEVLAVIGNLIPRFEISAPLFLIASAILAAYAYHVQSAANAHLALAHPGAAAAPLTLGEVVSATLGGIVFLLGVAALVYLALAG